MASWQGLNYSFLLGTEQIKILPPFYYVYKLYEIKIFQGMINRIDKLYSLRVVIKNGCIL